ncbi:ABC transporter substrate-binding protein [Mycobacterium sp. NAZ190054]|uniref:ABC transporter substrate-binding protein n=1 Tax=Mycobacterium sp. NAZ190054 TaxID=1747766 RepID=UPI0009ECB2B3|nr:ABC transporter substrate-binding protein [Mycobacterium sp. NAZ190054]
MSDTAKKFAAAALGMAMLVTATACSTGGGGSDAGGDDGTPVVRFQVLESDPASIPLQIMIDQGIDKKHGFQAAEVVVDPDASLSTFLLGESDIATDQDGISLAIAQQEGKNAVGFAGALNMMTGVVASDASGINDPEGLRGRRVGHFGLDTGTTTAINVMFEELYGIKIQDDLDLREAGAAALPELMASGQVDAIFDYEPFALRATMIGPGKYIFQPAKAWAEHTGGYSPNLALLAARTEWLDENRDLALKARDAWFEAVGVIADSNYEILKEPKYAEILALRDDAELDAFVKYCADLPCYPTEWSQQDVDGTMDWLQLFADRKLLIDAMPAQPVAVNLEES